MQKELSNIGTANETYLPYTLYSALCIRTPKNNLYAVLRMLPYSQPSAGSVPHFYLLQLKGKHWRILQFYLSTAFVMWNVDIKKGGGKQKRYWFWAKTIVIRKKQDTGPQYLAIEYPHQNDPPHWIWSHRSKIYPVSSSIHPELWKSHYGPLKMSKLGK